MIAAVIGIPGCGSTILASVTHGGLWDEWFPDVAVLNRGIGGERSDGLQPLRDLPVDGAATA